MNKILPTMAALLVTALACTSADAGIVHKGVEGTKKGVGSAVEGTKKGVGAAVNGTKTGFHKSVDGTKKALKKVHL